MDFSNLETFEETSEDYPQSPKKVDLSGDLMVNDMIDHNYINPDAEIIPTKKFEKMEQKDETHKDLSRDTYINEIAAERGYPENPDAETVENSDKFSGLETFDEIDARPPRWHDLSRDTYINELAANNPHFVNPDAEFIPQYTDDIVGLNGEPLQGSNYEYKPSRYRRN